jgi:hypothetical protein
LNSLSLHFNGLFFSNLKTCALDQVRDPFQRYVIAIGSWTFSAKPSDETHAGRSAPPRGSEVGEMGEVSPELGYQSLQSLETLGRASLSSPRVAPAVPLTLLSFSLRFLPDHAYFRRPSPSEIPGLVAYSIGGCRQPVWQIPIRHPIHT